MTASQPPSVNDCARVTLPPALAARLGLPQHPPLDAVRETCRVYDPAGGAWREYPALTITVWRRSSRGLNLQCAVSTWKRPVRAAQ